MTNESFFSFRFFMFLCLYYIIENVVVALSASGSFIGIGDDVLLNINHQGTTYYAVYCMISIQHLIRFAKIHSVIAKKSTEHHCDKCFYRKTIEYRALWFIYKFAIEYPLHYILKKRQYTQIHAD